MAEFSRILPLVVASALFMENMDSTVIATSLPAIAHDLRVDPVILKLAFTTYLLSLTVFIPISGWTADRFGARNVFRAAIAVFTLGSIACGFAQSLEGLVAARAVQGLGGRNDGAGRTAHPAADDSQERSLSMRSPISRCRP